MLKVKQLNILCTGEETSQKSAFLSFYTNTPHTNQKYRIFLHQLTINDQKYVVFLHEISEKDAIDVYLKYPFDAILFFVKNDAFHKTSQNILENVMLYSQINGSNIYKIPLKVVAVSNKNGNYYDDIGYGDKKLLYDQVCDILQKEQIIYVQFNQQYKQKLNQFYTNIVNDDTLGIRESVYSNWYFKGIHLFQSQQLKLACFKIYEEVRYLAYSILIVMRIYRKNMMNS